MTFPTTGDLGTAARGSAIAVARVRSVQPPRPGIAAVVLEPPLPVAGGSVTLDPSAEVWATAALELAPQWPDDGRWIRSGSGVTFPLAGLGDPGSPLWPETPADPLSPYAREVFVEAGLEYGNGQVTYVGLMLGRIWEPEQDPAPHGPIVVTAYDRAAVLRDSRLTAPVSFPAGTSVAAIFARLVGPASYPYFPATIFDYDAGSDRISGGMVCERERLEFLTELATSRGKVFHFDSTGTPRVRAVPEPTPWTFDVDAGPAGVLSGWGRKMSREGIYSAVVAEGEQTGDAPPPRAVVKDENPDSPTWWDGDFGQIPRFYASPFLTTEAQCRSAAAALLVRSSGLPFTLDLSIAPNPALRPYDAVRVFPRGQADPFGYEVHQLERVTIPLAPGQPMTSTTRQKYTFARPTVPPPVPPTPGAGTVLLAPVGVRLDPRPLPLQAVLPAPLLTRKIFASVNYEGHPGGSPPAPPSSVITSGTLQDDVDWFDDQLAAAAGQPGRRLFGTHFYSGSWPATFASTPSAWSALNGWPGSLQNLRFGSWGTAWDNAAAGAYDVHCRNYCLSVLDFIEANNLPQHVHVIVISHEPENDKDSNYGGPADDGNVWEPRWGPAWSRFTGRFANVVAELDLPNVFFAVVHMGVTFPTSGQFGDLGLKNRNPEMWNPWQYMTEAAKARTIFAPDFYTDVLNVAGTSFESMVTKFNRIRDYVIDAGWGVQRYGVSEHTWNNDVGAPGSAVGNIIRTHQLPFLRSFPGSSLAYFATFNTSSGLASGNNGWYDTPEEVDAFSEIVEEFNFGATPGGGGAGVLFRAYAGATQNNALPSLTIPASAQVDDTCWLVHDCTASVVVGAPTQPGWTLVASAASNNAGVEVWRKRLTAGDIGQPVTPTMSGVSRWAMQSIIYSGVDAATPEDVAPVISTDNVTATTHTTGAITPVTPDATVLQLAANRGTTTASTGLWTPPAGLTPRGSVPAGGNPGASVAAADLPNAAAGVAAGPYQWASDVALGNFVGIAIAIRPA